MTVTFFGKFDLVTRAVTVDTTNKALRTAIANHQLKVFTLANNRARWSRGSYVFMIIC